MKIKIKKLKESAVMPTRGTSGAACFDLYTPMDFGVKIGRNVIPLFFAIELEKGTYAEIRPRSGFSAKGIEDNMLIRRDADVKHGVVDEDYRDGVGVLLYSKETFTIAKGTRIAQMLIAKYEQCTLIEDSELTETDRKGGFGHTGTR